MIFTIEAINAFIVDLDSFQSSPELLRQILPVLQPYKAGFVSSSRDIDVAQFGIDPALVFYSESLAESMLFQNVIRRAMSQLGMARNETAFIAGAESSLKPAQELLLGTFLLVPEAVYNANKLSIHRNMPDFIVRYAAAELQNILDGKLCGHFAEDAVSWPQLHPFKLESKSVYHFEVAAENRPDVKVAFGGRYFKTEDARYGLHPLSLRIINAKNYPDRHADMFSNIFAHLIMWQTKGDFDLVAVVPPRPGKDDRNAKYALQLPQRNLFKNAGIGNERIAIDALRCIRDYGSLKTSGGAHRRAEEIKGAFEASPSVRGKKVVVLDDIYSTGSTMNECIETLLSAGASQVLPSVLAYHPLHCISLSRLDESEPLCGGCQAAMVPRFNKQTGEVFYGCSNFFNGGSHDRKNFVEVQRLRISRAEQRIMAIDDDDFDIWNMPF